MTKSNQDFVTYQGDAAQPVFTVTDSAGAPINLSSVQEIEWTAQRDLGSAVVVTKTKTTGGTTLISGGTTGKFMVNLTAADTAALTGYYLHEAVVTDAAGNRSTVSTGRMQVGRLPVATYSGDPQNSPRDAFRLALGDTDPATPLFYDTEVDYLLAQNAGPLYAAAQGARILSGRFAKQALSKRVGDLALTYQNQSATYAALALELESQAAIHGSTIYVGGVSRSDMASVAANSDRVKQPFTIKQFDMPGASQRAGGDCE